MNCCRLYLSDANFSLVPNDDNISQYLLMFFTGECGSLHHVSSRLKYSIQLPPPGEHQHASIVESSVLFDDAPIDLNRVFKVAVSADYADQDDKFGYSFIKKAPRVVHEEFASQIHDIISMYCERNRENPSKNPANPTMGRITVLQVEEIDASNSLSLPHPSYADLAQVHASTTRRDKSDVRVKK